MLNQEIDLPRYVHKYLHRLMFWDACLVLRPKACSQNVDFSADRGICIWLLGYSSSLSFFEDGRAKNRNASFLEEFNETNIF